MKINNINVFLETIGFFSLFLIVLVIGSIFPNSGITTYLAITVFFIYTLYLYIRAKRFVLLFSFIIIYIATNIFGVYTIETSNIYLSELGRFSFKTGALLPIIFVHYLFIQTLYILFEIFPIKSNKINIKYLFKKSISSDVLQKIIVNFNIILVSVLLLRVINKPTFLLGIDRFNFEKLYLTGIYSKFTSLIMILAPVVYNFYYKNKAKVALFSFLLSILYLIWIGHKFGSLFVIFYFVSLNYIVNLPKHLLKRITKVGILLIIFLLSLVSIQSFTAYNRDFSSNLQYINARIAQQGQMWWAIYNEEKSQSPHINELDDETAVWLDSNKKQEYSYGIYKMMRKVTPPQIFEMKIFVKHSRYAYSTQASIFYYFGYVGLLVFTVFSAILYYFMIRIVIGALVDSDVISLLLSIRVVNILHYVLQQSDFDQLVSIEFLFLIGGLFIMHFFKRSQR